MRATADFYEGVTGIYWEVASSGQLACAVRGPGDTMDYIRGTLEEMGKSIWDCLQALDQKYTVCCLSWAQHNQGHLVVKMAEGL